MRVSFRNPSLRRQVHLSRRGEWEWIWLGWGSWWKTPFLKELSWLGEKGRGSRMGADPSQTMVKHQLAEKLRPLPARSFRFVSCGRARTVKKKSSESRPCPRFVVGLHIYFRVQVLTHRYRSADYSYHRRCIVQHRVPFRLTVCLASTQR